MSENLHLVFSKPPEAISDEEYNRWYDFHLGEILVVPGFVSARRYRLQTVKGEWTPSGHRYLSAYEIEGDPRDVMRELDKEVASGRMQLPDWRGAYRQYKLQRAKKKFQVYMKKHGGGGPFVN